MKKVILRIAASAITIFMLAQNASAAQLLVPVGQVVGLQINEDQVTIEGFDSQLGSVAGKPVSWKVTGLPKSMSRRSTAPKISAEPCKCLMGMWIYIL